MIYKWDYKEYIQLQTVVMQLCIVLTLTPILPQSYHSQAIDSNTTLLTTSFSFT